MTVRQLTCYVLDCDTCGNVIESVEYEGATNEIHSDSAEKARAGLIGDPDQDSDGRAFLDGHHLDGKDICGECNAKRVCGERGHRWSGWFGPTLDGDYQWRHCERDHCTAYERRPLEVPA